MQDDLSYEKLGEYADYLRDIERDARDEMDDRLDEEYRAAICNRLNKAIEIRNSSVVAKHAGADELPKVYRVLSVLDKSEIHTQGQQYYDYTLIVYCGGYVPRFVFFAESVQWTDYESNFQFSFSIVMDAASETPVLNDGERLGPNSYKWQDKVWKFDYSNEVFTLDNSKGENADDS